MTGSLAGGFSPAHHNGIYDAMHPLIYIGMQMLRGSSLAVLRRVAVLIFYASGMQIPFILAAAAVQFSKLLK